MLPQRDDPKSLSFLDQHIVVLVALGQRSLMQQPSHGCARHVTLPGLVGCGRANTLACWPWPTSYDQARCNGTWCGGRVQGCRGAGVRWWGASAALSLAEPLFASTVSVHVKALPMQSHCSRALTRSFASTWEAGLFLRTPFTEGCAGANEKASPPGRQQRYTVRPTTFSSVQTLGLVMLRALATAPASKASEDAGNAAAPKPYTFAYLGQ